MNLSLLCIRYRQTATENCSVHVKEFNENIMNFKNWQPWMASQIDEQSLPPFLFSYSLEFQPNKILSPFPWTPLLQPRVDVIYSFRWYLWWSLQHPLPVVMNCICPITESFFSRNMLWYTDGCKTVQTATDSNRSWYKQASPPQYWCECTSMLHWYHVLWKKYN